MHRNDWLGRDKWSRCRSEHGTSKDSFIHERRGETGTIFSNYLLWMCFAETWFFLMHTNFRNQERLLFLLRLSSMNRLQLLIEVVFITVCKKDDNLSVKEWPGAVDLIVIGTDRERMQMRSVLMHYFNRCKFRDFISKNEKTIGARISIHFVHKRSNLVRSISNVPNKS